MWLRAFNLKQNNEVMLLSVLSKNIGNVGESIRTTNFLRKIDLYCIYFAFDGFNGKMFNLNIIVSSEKQIEYFWNNLIELSIERKHSSRFLRLSFRHSHEVKSRRPHWGIWGHSHQQARCCFWGFHSKVNLQNADASHMHKRFWIQKCIFSKAGRQPRLKRSLYKTFYP